MVTSWDDEAWARATQQCDPLPPVLIRRDPLDPDPLDPDPLDPDLHRRRRRRARLAGVVLMLVLLAVIVATAAIGPTA